MTFFGHVVSSDGIRTDLEKTCAIETIPPPKVVRFVNIYGNGKSDVSTKHS